MGLMDNLGDKVKDVMNDPEKKQKIEQIAKDKGISMEQAKEHFAKHKDNQ
jgi:hypothetical protein